MDNLNSKVDKVGKIRILLTPTNDIKVGEGLCWVEKEPSASRVGGFIAKVQQLTVNDNCEVATWEDVEIVMANESIISPENIHG